MLWSPLQFARVFYSPAVLPEFGCRKKPQVSNWNNNLYFADLKELNVCGGFKKKKKKEAEKKKNLSPLPSYILNISMVY